MNEKIKLFALRKGSIGDHLWLDGRMIEPQTPAEGITLQAKFKDSTHYRVRCRKLFMRLWQIMEI